MLKRMKWIGLTGGIASGKSTVSKLFVKSGIPVVDADQLAHRVVEPGSAGLRSVVAAFGNEILDSQGALDRKKLAAKVFADAKALLLLESLIHPLVQQQTQLEKTAAEKRGAAMAVYDVPLLYEKNLQDQFDAVVLVWSDRETQMARMKERDALSLDEIEKRLNAQISLDQKKLRADFVIENNSDLLTLETNFKKVLAELQSLKE